MWEFSGNPVYFCSYDYFAANDPTSIHVIVFSLEEPYEIQLNQVIFWLSFLKSLVPVEEPVGKLRQPRVSEHAPRWPPPPLPGWAPVACGRRARTPAPLLPAGRLTLGEAPEAQLFVVFRRESFHDHIFLPET